MTTRTAVLLVLSFLVAATLSCGGEGKSGPTSPSPRGLYRGRYAASDTGNPLIPSLAVDSEGAALGVLKGSGGPNTTGAIYVRGSNRLTVLRGDHGLPARLVANDVVFAFENYTGTTVDIAAVAADGRRQIVRQVPIDTVAAARLSVSARIAPTSAVLLSADPLKDAATILSFAVCSVAAGGAFAAGGPVGVALVWPEIAAACGAPLVLLLKESGAIDAALASAFDDAQAVQVIADAFGCVAPTAGAVLTCVSTLLDLAQQAASAVLGAARGLRDALDELLKSYVVFGRVTDAVTRSPIPGALIEILNPNPVGVTTNSQGYYSISPFPSAPGVYRVQASANKYFTQAVEISVTGSTLADFGLKGVEGCQYTGSIGGQITQNVTYSVGYSCTYRAQTDLSGITLSFSEAGARLGGAAPGNTVFSFVNGSPRCSGGGGGESNQHLLPTMELVSNGTDFVGTARLLEGRTPAPNVTTLEDEIRVNVERTSQGVSGQYRLRFRNRSDFAATPGQAAYSAEALHEASIPFLLMKTACP